MNEDKIYVDVNATFTKDGMLLRILQTTLASQARRGICGISIVACCALRLRNICVGRWAAFGRIPLWQAPPSGAICC